MIVCVYMHLQSLIKREFDKLTEFNLWVTYDTE